MLALREIENKDGGRAGATLNKQITQALKRSNAAEAIAVYNRWLFQ